MPLSKYDIEAAQVAEPGTSHSFLVDMVGSNKRVLDVGCDTGYLGEVLGAVGNKVWGFEISEATAAQARTRLVDCAVGDLEQTDLASVFEPGSFDVVIFGDVLEHLRDPLPVLRSTRRLLAAGGSVLLSTPNIAHGDVRLALLHGQFRYNKLGILDETHTRFFTAESLVSFARDAGFEIAELRRTRAELFTTEIGVNESDFPAELVARLRADNEASTYQFVARLVPDDAGVMVTQQALRVDELAAELDRARSELAVQAAELTSLRADRQSLAEQTEQLRTAHDEAVRQRDHLLAEVRELRSAMPATGGLARRLMGRVGR
ncbi:methyltransferase domain-containing protein [Jatrophihabitans telluris]|uniref:Methyltransferase domain-containing protein n=1 Tax=Jatrophihabitans telluris TaxID=2038343 RepID=A0ABY4QWC1_9ACTN|nr:class I SAM-dependent methyltransferase [Jatrophihabitans telluris]UQX87557.1 methyltransferase domain-containing protein [Jatrophihabitans telluris]